MKIDLSNPAGIRSLKPTAPSHQQQVESAQQLQDVYREFVGKTFFGQLLKSMRNTVGKPAYFHGGQAEEVFRSQLDQTLAEHMTNASADQIADPMFRHQFPDQAQLLADAESKENASLADLGQLRRF